jgi:hypothetical protein
MSFFIGLLSGSQNEICTCIPTPPNCTCGISQNNLPHLTLNDRNQGQMSLDENSHHEGNPFNNVSADDDENYSQNHRDESSLASAANERDSYDASSEISQRARPTRRRSRPRSRVRGRSSGYDATFEDSVDVDATFRPKFHSSLIGNQNRSRRNPSMTRGEEINLFEPNQCECYADDPEPPRGRRDSSMDQSERGRRNQLHEMLDEESAFTANESLLDINDDPSNANILGYNYRVNSFR